MSQDHSSEITQPRIAIIGAGVGGLSFAMALKRQLGFENFTIFEKAQSVGGTWRDNVYPGCSSDVSVHFYSNSKELKSDWTCTHPFQPEIEAYWNDLSEKHSLKSHILFNCKVTDARWDNDKQFYRLTTEDVNTGKRSSTTAQVLVSALGILEVPRYPNISGLLKFQGTIFHSARWLQTELSGKRVAVIGNGASATQFLPIISKRPGIHVTQFCRTPNWILPPIRTWFSSSTKWAFGNIPLAMRLYRFVLFLLTELSYLMIFHNSFCRSIVTWRLKHYISQHAPEKYLKNLIPDYALGCKRVIFDTDYLSAIHQENVDLNWDGIKSVVGDGIVTQTGKHIPFDVIILATGYAADKYPLPVHGVKQSIQAYHHSQGGPTAYLGTSTPGFPNFFMLGGPNTSTGHTSVLFTEEIQSDYIIKLIKPILDRKVTSLDVTSGATDAYNSKLQSRLSKSVFVGCNSWYRVDNTGKVNSMFPGSGSLFIWWLRRPKWEDYVPGNIKAEQWAEEIRFNWPVEVCLGALAVVLGGLWLVQTRIYAPM